MTSMRALSIRQPWAWLILHGGKDVENRTWCTRFRGRFLIHAAKGCTLREYEDACVFARKAGFRGSIPALEDLPRGGIVGSVVLTGCVHRSDSPWFCGPIGFALKDPESLPFRSCCGALGFFRPFFRPGTPATTTAAECEKIFGGRVEWRGDAEKGALK